MERVRSNSSCWSASICWNMLLSMMTRMSQNLLKITVLPRLDIVVLDMGVAQ